MPSIDGAGERFSCLPTKGLLPRLSVSSAILSLLPPLPLKGIQCLSCAGVLRSALKATRSAYFPTRAELQSIITFAYACFVNRSINLGLLEDAKYC